ncbi:MAG TPA: ABC transporter ATP-binding protein [Acidimicrobiales bacterium]|nr:ABC transporter ATP-binding protein [Acidimicrobiales bacterium]
MTDVGPAIELDGAGKRYERLTEQPLLLRSLLPFSRPTRTDTWALREVTASIAPGETVGVLGRNGAGKTTMLRLLAGVTRPSAGSVTVRGRVAPLISVGVGFHPEMTGRENVQVNGMLLGLSREEVNERFDDVVAFAELGEVIDTPVKFYSSGMFMRLGFSVAVHVDPQVLLVDEVLAVGDIAFQLKCFERMRALQAGGTTIVLVSHSMHAIRLLCPRVLLLREGHLDLDGDSEAAIARHHDLLGREGAGGQGAHLGQVELLERGIEGKAGPVTSTDAHAPLRYAARLRFLADVDSPHLYFNVVAEDGTPVYEMKSAIGKAGRSYRAGDEAKVEVRFRAHLGGGTYRLQLTITDRTGRVALLRDPVGALLYVPPPLGTAGVTDLAAQIRLDGKRVTDHDALMLQADVGEA